MRRYFTFIILNSIAPSNINAALLLTNNASYEGHSGLFLSDHLGVLRTAFGPASDSHHELDAGVCLTKRREVAKAIFLYVQLLTELFHI